MRRRVSLCGTPVLSAGPLLLGPLVHVRVLRAVCLALAGILSPVLAWMASAQELDSGVRASSAIFADDRCLLCPRVGWCGGVRLKNFAA